MIIGMVLFPNLTQLDLTGPYEVFGRMPSTKVLLVSESLAPVKSDYGLLLTPDATFNDCPQVDILFVPGGKGIFEAMQNKKLIGFLKQQAVKATYITSVCTGALVLATAGLLDGYKATTHWLSLDLLKLFPVEVVKQRVVVDRNRITGGGVTAGIDFGLSVAAELFGEDVAKDAQLFMEYNPAPPFNAGSPETAGKEVVEQVIASRAAIQHERAQLVKKLLSER
ncbi:MAG TPA: DJ-1/PfpI family protein [Panacibacter sp.]|nr:DJ-1/PfpI family protein [Panacibacter sp.]HNP45186.1 DJ-1/PfpI family protein [Panacibacter sp.]